MERGKHTIIRRTHTIRFSSSVFFFSPARPDLALAVWVITGSPFFSFWRVEDRERFCCASGVVRVACRTLFWGCRGSGSRMPVTSHRESGFSIRCGISCVLSGVNKKFGVLFVVVSCLNCAAVLGGMIYPLGVVSTEKRAGWRGMPRQHFVKLCMGARKA